MSETKIQLTTTNLFDGGTYDLTAGAMRDMLARARDDGLVSLAVNVRLADGAVVTRTPTRVRIDHKRVEVLGLEVVGITIDVEVLLDLDPEVRIALWHDRIGRVLRPRVLRLTAGMPRKAGDAAGRMTR